MGYTRRRSLAHTSPCVVVWLVANGMFRVEHRGFAQWAAGVIKGPALLTAQEEGGCPGSGIVMDVTGCQSIRQPTSPSPSFLPRPLATSVALLNTDLARPPVPANGATHFKVSCVCDVGEFTSTRRETSLLSSFCLEPSALTADRRVSDCGGS